MTRKEITLSLIALFIWFLNGLLIGFFIGQILYNEPSETCQVTYNEKAYDVPCEVLNDR
jgi:hypothetical protein